MIIIGYQGIGKSTLAKCGKDYIDLESGNFFVDGVRPDGWEKIYAQIARHLSEQGYTVFVSSHKAVRDALRYIGVPVGVCYPSVELKDAWIDKLQKRYDDSHLEKDYRALKNAVDRYEDNISKIVDDGVRYGFYLLPIRSIEYNLFDLIPHCN